MKHLFTCAEVDEIKTTNSFFAFNLPHNGRDLELYVVVVVVFSRRDHSCSSEEQPNWLEQET